MATFLKRQLKTRSVMRRTLTTRLCHRTGKLMYETEREAELAGADLVAARAYYCDWVGSHRGCEHWHVTRQPKDHRG